MDCWWIIFIFLHGLYFLNFGNALTTVDYGDLRSLWANLTAKYEDRQRNQTILPDLKFVAGLYDHPFDLGALNSKLENTVLTLVIQSYDPRDLNEKYRHFLFNLLCFFKQYRLKVAIFIIAQDNRLFEMNKVDITSFYHNVRVLSYPYELFWKIVSRKNSPMYVDKGRADFKGDFPTFEHFGALPMLIPLLEVLQLGFNLIYFDLDIAFMEDPIPHLLLGDADINIAPEVRSCSYPSFMFESLWPSVEPNTGTMYIKSSPKTIAFFEEFLGRVVNSNMMNDQRCVDFGKLENTMWTKSCDPYAQYLPPYKRQQLGNVSEISNKTLKYCFLNEFVFHNGYMELFCAKGRRGVKTTMYHLALSIYGASVKNNRRKISYLLNPILPIGINTFPHYAAIHVNYCGTKHRCLEDRGFWLHQRQESKNHTHYIHTCRNFNASHTPQGRHNWTEALEQASNEFRKEYDAVFRDDNQKTLLQFHRKAQVFFWNRSHDGGVLQPYHDLQTLKWHQGDDFEKKLIVVKDPWFTLFPYGEEIFMNNPL